MLLKHNFYLKSSQLNFDLNYKFETQPILPGACSMDLFELLWPLTCDLAALWHTGHLHN